MSKQCAPWYRWLTCPPRHQQAHAAGRSPLVGRHGFPITKENECARQRFIEDAQFEKLIVELPSYLAPIATVGYQTGIRLGELKRIEWSPVDFDARLIRLRAGRTKGGKPRTCPFIGNMYDVLQSAKAGWDEFWPYCDFVFHRPAACGETGPPAHFGRGTSCK